MKISQVTYQRPIVLSIAGFDPTAGAGVLADIKTIEQHQCLGMAINTAITNQVEDAFFSLEWMSVESIKLQLQNLMNKYNIQVVKIGIVQNLDDLKQIVDNIKLMNNNIKIIWDTVLVSSSGFKLFEKIETSKLIDVLKQITLITPNTNEILLLSGLKNEKEGAKHLSIYCNVLLKGGHSATEKGVDYLYTNNNLTKLEGEKNKDFSPKHGSGCILSSAIAANLALGFSLESSCKNAKNYIEKILNSNTQLLAYHVA